MSNELSDNDSSFGALSCDPPGPLPADHGGGRDHGDDDSHALRVTSYGRVIVPAGTRPDGEGG